MASGRRRDDAGPSRWHAARLAMVVSSMAPYGLPSPNLRKNQNPVWPSVKRTLVFAGSFLGFHVRLVDSTKASLVGVICPMDPTEFTVCLPVPVGV